MKGQALHRMQAGETVGGKRGEGEPGELELEGQVVRYLPGRVMVQAAPDMAIVCSRAGRCLRCFTCLTWPLFSTL